MTIKQFFNRFRNLENTNEYYLIQAIDEWDELWTEEFLSTTEISYFVTLVKKYFNSINLDIPRCLRRGVNSSPFP